MLRWLRSAAPVAALLAAAAPASAHFVFVVPEPGGRRASVILSEDLRPDDGVDVGIIAAGTTLAVRSAGGREAPLPLAKGDHAFTVELPAAAAAAAGEPAAAGTAAAATRVVRGQTVLGVQQRGNGKPFLLTYHPKTIVGDAFDPAATLGDAAPAEIVPVGRPGAVRFRVFAGGRPVAGAEVRVILPDGTERKAPTDADGQTEAFAAAGRYGAWVRCPEAAAGEHAGKRYEEIRRYPTLVADVGGVAASPATGPAATNPPATAPAAAASDAKPASAAAAPHGELAVDAERARARHAAMASPATAPAVAGGGLAVTTPLPRLPEATSSFGAAVSDGWLYVYGGHVSKTHTYWTAAVSGRFHRINLAAPAGGWEELPGGPGLQGMNLAAHGGRVYRVGGMAPRNAAGERADLHSVADCAAYDPAGRKWEPLPPLPEPRSSHDVAVVGDRLVVIGGWNMRGRTGGNDWIGHALVLDLSAKQPAWRAVKQPFERRALIAAVRGGRVYAIGGFDEESEPSRRVEVYDPAADRWSAGPDLPGPDRNGFAPAACTVGDDLYVSVGDGSLYRLADDPSTAGGGRWDRVATTTPRIVHRLAPDRTRILVVGGANRGDNSDLVEAVDVGGAGRGAAKADAR